MNGNQYYYPFKPVYPVLPGNDYRNMTKRIIKMQKTDASFLLTALVTWFLLACGPVQAAQSSSTNAISNTRVTAPPALRTGISLKQLDNMEYWTDHGKCQLTNGAYISQTFCEDIMIYREVMRGTYISGAHEVDHADHAFGDLNNDGLEDAVVILRENTGGTGVFISLAVVMNERGKLRNTATVLMGDRQEITSLAIAAGMIRVSGFTHRPGERYMQPTLPAIWIYRSNGETMELIAGPKVEDPDEYGKRFEQLMNSEQEREEIIAGNEIL